MLYPIQDIKESTELFKKQIAQSYSNTSRKPAGVQVYTWCLKYFNG